MILAIYRCSPSISINTRLFAYCRLPASLLHVTCFVTTTRLALSKLWRSFFSVVARVNMLPRSTQKYPAKGHSQSCYKVSASGNEELCVKSDEIHSLLFVVYVVQHCQHRLYCLVRDIEVLGQMPPRNRRLGRLLLFFSLAGRRLRLAFGLHWSFLLLGGEYKPVDTGNQVEQQGNHPGARQLPRGHTHAAQRRSREGHDPLRVVGEPAIWEPEHRLLCVPEGHQVLWRFREE